MSRERPQQEIREMPFVRFRKMSDYSLPRNIFHKNFTNTLCHICIHWIQDIYADPSHKSSSTSMLSSETGSRSADGKW